MTSMRDLASGTTDERDETLRRQAAELERLRAEVAAWRKRYEKGVKRDIAFSNSEGEVEPLYTALDTVGQSAPDDSLPGAAYDVSVQASVPLDAAVRYRTSTYRHYYDLSGFGSGHYVFAFSDPISGTSKSVAFTL